VSRPRNVRTSRRSKSSPNCHRRVVPGEGSEGSRLPWGFLPFDACGRGQRLMPGLPPPATRRPRASSAPRRVAPPPSSPALFHAGSALGLSAFRGFPSAVAGAPLDATCPSCRSIAIGSVIGQDEQRSDLGFRGSSIRRVRTRRAGVTRCPSSRSSRSVDLFEVFPTRPRLRASTKPPLLGFFTMLPPGVSKNTRRHHRARSSESQRTAG
jgi:hypothetical protein